MLIPVLINKQKDDDITARVPALPDFRLNGRSVEEVMSKLKFQLCCEMVKMEEAGTLPENFGTIEDWQSKQADPQGFWTLIEVPDNRNKVRFNVSWPQDLLDKVDRYIVGRKLSRSGFLAHAVSEYMNSKP